MIEGLFPGDQTFVPSSMLVRRLTTVLLVVCGCTFHSPLVSDGEPADGAADGSRPADAMTSAAAASSCAELDASVAGTDVTLYLDHDRSKPYAAHCGPGLETYLTLGAPNTSSYPIGSCARVIAGQAAAVTTTWTMVRFDPGTRTVDTSDSFGASSTGGTHEDSGNNTIHIDYSEMPFGSGRTCSTSQREVATIDLTHTNFAIAPTQKWAYDGFMANPQLQLDSSRKTGALNIGGFPVGASPCAPNFDYYTQHGGPCLVLDYAP